ncbi:ARM repeat-containing protein [Punctularia strigosozonata HHB-11173 SS5]|uniref:ARM repeat-containing protein n=1 Tax=Punctularia strigosozonata (strain HHB-11173) TaxID=741275 RepID=UPI0004416DD4|nr:ARM repeat-containing protein [Punctularia strigosozonata HHB-11173 SS5]EIN13904.1 ARM repeat-containing protein [Punctularia strigosozonata HHB-11173 SS5]
MSHDQELDALLQRSAEKSLKSLNEEETACLVSSFLPSHPPAARSKAYLILSSFCQAVRSAYQTTTQSESDPAAASIARSFSSHVLEKLSGANEYDTLASISFLIALYQVDWQAATSILSRDGIIDAVMDALDLFSSSKAINLALAHLLSQASGHTTARAMLPSQCSEWLVAKSSQKTDPALRAAAVVALVKLSRAESSDASATKPAEGVATDDELANLMKDLLLEGKDESSVADAIEGLAYTSTDPRVKESLSQDEPFLRRLFSLVPKRQKSILQGLQEDRNTAVLYGIVIIIANICGYRPRISKEQAQVERLKRMTKTGASRSGKLVDPGSDPLEDDTRVKERGSRIVKLGAIDALVSAARGVDSRGVRVGVANALLSLVEDRENRGRALQSGAAKTLMAIMRASPALVGDTKSSVDPADLLAVQALAKLAITSSPIQVFGPDPGVMYDTIRPFSILLMSSSSNLLQRFEALMALTNIASHGPEACSRIAKTDGLMNKVELLLLEDHEMVRRAATELLCNLVAGSEEAFERYSSENGAKSRLHILVALADVEDLPTRMAASGALAALTSSPNTCRTLMELQRERHSMLSIVAQLIDPSVGVAGDDNTEPRNPALVHRGVVWARNIWAGCPETDARKDLVKEAEASGLVRALTGLVRDAPKVDPAILQPTAELLRLLVGSGIDIKF